jgi:nucleoporin NUP2
VLGEKEKVVSFIGHEMDGSGSASFKIRLKTLDQATELKEAMDREIAFVKGGVE